MNKEQNLNESQNPQLNTPAVMHRAGEDIGVKDKNRNDIFVGSVIKHNDNLYLIKWSDKQKRFVARAEPIAGQTKSWRDKKWIQNLSDKYIEMIGTILFDEEMRKRFDGVYR